MYIFKCKYIHAYIQHLVEWSKSNVRARLVAAAHSNTLQHTATPCNTLPHNATHCNTLQHTATHCNSLSL